MTAVGAVRSAPQVRSGMVVKGGMGKRLGTVSNVVTDHATGNLESFTVRYGLLRKKHKRMLAKQIRQINVDSVVVRFTHKEFQQLPDMDD